MLPFYFTLLFYLVLFVYAIIVGSFLNVCILRVPLKETIVSKRSHCMSCGHQLAWYDLFPLFSYLFLGGKCRYCKQKISPQYPIVEFINGIMAVLCFLFGGFNADNIVSNIGSLDFVTDLSFVVVDHQFGDIHAGG